MNGVRFSLMLGLFALLLGACGEISVGNDIPWTQNAAEHRGKIGQRFSYSCAADGTAGSVWGTDVYTDDSSICTAAVHAGEITIMLGGTVTIEILAGLSSYTGSERNGVTSNDYGVWDGSFAFPL